MLLGLVGCWWKTRHKAFGASREKEHFKTFDVELPDNFGVDPDDELLFEEGEPLSP